METFGIIGFIFRVTALAKVITLEKRGHIIICTVRFRAKLNYGGTKCFEP